MVLAGVLTSAAVLVLALWVRGSEPSADDEPSEAPQHGRAFHGDSWWNTRLPDHPPLHWASDQILDYMANAPESGGGCLRLAGAGSSSWGQPIYESQPSDPEYDVSGVIQERPPELARLRIPATARPSDNSDRSMTVFDRRRGYVVALSGADFDGASESWSATGATVTYLDSNGLHVDTGRSDESRNRGTHRGNNGATMAVMLRELEAGAIDHVLKIAIGPEASHRFVFPMVGSDGDYTGTDPAVPPQGLRLRIRPSVDLEDFDLHRDALVIARALQRYGVYIGDSGGRTSLKLEDTVVQGRGAQWGLGPEDLCDLPFVPDIWHVLPEGYDPAREEGGHG